MIIHRRSVLTGLVSSLAAPAIIRASSLMPVKVFSETYGRSPLLDLLLPAGAWRGYNFGMHRPYLRPEFAVCPVSIQ